MLELLSPQPLPRVERRATRPVDSQVIEWSPGEPLPWRSLPPPKPYRKTPRVWQHSVYLGVYDVEDTYPTLHRLFADDPDAYDERARGMSACAGLLIDHEGRVVPETPNPVIRAVGGRQAPGSRPRRSHLEPWFRVRAG